MKKLIVLLVLLSGFGISAKAEGEIFDAKIVGNTLSMDIQWANSQFLNIGVVPDGLVYSASEEDAEKCILLTVRTDDDGNYSDSIVLPDSLAGGKYNVFATDGTVKKQEDLFYVNINDPALTEFLRLLNLNTTTIEEFGNLTRDNAPKLGVDTEEYSTYSSDFISVLYNNRGSYTITGYADMLVCAVATEKLKESADINRSDEIIRQSETAFGVDYDMDYASEPAEVRSAAVNSYIASDFSKGNYSDIFKSKLISQKLSACKSYTEYANVVIKYKDYLGIDYSKYNALSGEQKAVVMSKMYTGKVFDTSNVASALSGYMNEQTVTATPAPSLPSGGGSGGGGGGGSSSGGVTMPNYITKEDVLDSLKTSAFSDTDGHWAEEYITELSEKGVINGFPDNTFRPSDLVTRAQFVKMLCVVLNLEEVDEAVFEDVTENDWCYKIVAAAYNSDIIAGHNNKFNPHDNITRQDCAVIMKNALEFKSIKGTGEVSFSDAGEISDYALEAVGMLCGKSVINGYDDNTFRPFANATRAESAKMIHTLIEALAEVTNY